MSEETARISLLNVERWRREVKNKNEETYNFVSYDYYCFGYI